MKGRNAIEIFVADINLYHQLVHIRCRMLSLPQASSPRQLSAGVADMGVDHQRE